MANAGGGIDLELEARLEQHVDADLLQRVAVTLGSTLDLKRVLHHLAEIGREASDAQRCTIVLIEGNRLRPAVALGVQADDDLWSAFRSMPPIELGPGEWELLERGRAVAVEDARASDYIPRDWIERFSLRAIVLVPLVAHGKPRGIMAVDWPEVRQVPSKDVAVLEAIGVYAGLAIHNAQLHQTMAAKSRTLEHLVEVAAALNSSPSLPQILELVCIAFEQVLGTSHCSVNLSDPADPLRLRTLASRGDGWFRRGSEVVPPEELLPVSQVRQSAEGPIVYPNIEALDESITAPSSIRSAALFPLFAQDDVVGAVVAGFPRAGGPVASELEAGQTLAELAAAAIGRADLHEQLQRRLHQLEILSQLSDVVTGDVSIDEVLSGVNTALSLHLGMEVTALVVADDEIRSSIGGLAPEPPEEEVIDGWRTSATSAQPPSLVDSHDGLLVPVVHHLHVFGGLRLSVNDRPVGLADEEFLRAVGGAFAEVLHRAMLSRALAESERRFAVAAERERIAHDLHDSAGQVVTGIGMKLAGYLDQAPDERWRHRLTTLLRLAREAERELREAIYSLVFVEVRDGGLIRSLRELANRFSTTTGIEVSVDVAGEGEALIPEHEEVLFRVAHEALSNIERHAEASRADVRLQLGPRLACLTVADDGMGFAGDGAPGAPRFGLRGIERRIREVGGTLHLTSLQPRGARVEARLVVQPSALPPLTG